MDAPHEIIVRKLKEHSRLSAEDIAGLHALTYRTRSLGPNEDLIRQGDKPNASALVMSGMVARYHTLTGGRRQYLSYHIAGDLPDAQTLFVERMDHAVAAIGDVQIALIAHDEIVALFEQRPSIGFAIWRETLIDAAIFREAITNNSSRSAVARMAHLFCELHYRARAAGLAKPGDYDLPLHQGLIGETLGMSTVTVNRTIQALRRTGAMDFRNRRLLVRNWRRLVQIGEFDPSYLHLKRPGRM